MVELPRVVYPPLTDKRTIVVTRMPSSWFNTLQWFVLIKIFFNDFKKTAVFQVTVLYECVTSVS